MQIRISQNDGTPIYQQVVSQVRLLVSSGRLAEGQQLPAVRKLAEQLLINPNTVARAYRELESAGIVVSRRGSGVFVSDSCSPLSRREKNRILNDRIDALLAEAVQLDFDLENVVTLVRQRGLRFCKGEKK
ncbi:MAG: GntR family transcriptional regulator [Fuerstiella sp.]|jgi:GntR family transcriptional regulator|nr:GntR family transcriptional regulator [Fuerstiella sp.]